MNEQEWQKLLERINNIKFNIILENKFFGNLLIHLMVKISDKTKTCATDGYYIYMNKDYVIKLNDIEIMFLLLHELYHIILFHLYRGLVYDNNKYFAMACDLVANANILNTFSISSNFDTLEIPKTTLPNGNSCINYTAEQVYDYIMENKDLFCLDDEELANGGSGSENVEDSENSEVKEGGSITIDNSSCESKNAKQKISITDDHSMWNKKDGKKKTQSDMNEMAITWQHRIIDVFQNVGKGCKMSNQIRKQIKKIMNPQIDWKVLLRNFVEEEINDYSFNPPDKRFNDNNVLLPDFNEVDEKVCNVFFFVDVSGSMSDEQISECVNEVRSCINQYNGKIDAYLGYFDYQVSNLKNFDDEESMLNVEALGGGGTSFINIFEYMKEHENEYDGVKKKIIILTDGYADYPTVDDVGDYELLWIINNDESSPTVGEIIRLETNN